MPLFSRKKTTSSTIDMSDYDTTKTDSVNEQSDQTDHSEEPRIKTELSIHPDWTLKPEQTYVFKFHSNTCPPLLPNQLSLYGIDLEHDQEKGQVKITAFIRSSLEKAIRLSPTPLLLLGPDGEKLGRKVFDLSQAGELPPHSSRPWYFTFNSEELTVQEFPYTDWKLAFEIKNKKPHQLDLEESWKQSLADGDKERLEELVANLKAPKPGEINFMGLQARQDDEGKLHVTLLIRNGSEEAIRVENLPLQVQDASGEIVAKGGFSLGDLEIKANTSKPWTFIFPKELLLKEELDLSKWKAQPIPSKTNA